VSELSNAALICFALASDVGSFTLLGGSNRLTYAGESGPRVLPVLTTVVI
jgi:hypothetical protein